MTTERAPRSPSSSPKMPPTAQLPSVLITGCSAGTIGHALALTFALRHNHHVFASARRLSTLASLAAIPNITLLELDITSAASVRTAHDLIATATGGALDILYHNAGVRAVEMALDTDAESARWMLDANFVAVVGLTHVFADLLLGAARRGEGGSKVVFTSSIAGRVPAPSNAVYSASKAALDVYADVLRAELRPLGVRVVTVVTGDVETAMSVQKMEELPQDSPYKPIESIINDAWTERKGVMKVDDYAEAVVKKVVQRRPPERIWEGSNSTLIWWIERLGLSWVLPIILERRFGLNKLTPRSP